MERSSFQWKFFINHTSDYDSWDLENLKFLRKKSISSMSASYEDSLPYESLHDNLKSLETISEAGISKSSSPTEEDNNDRGFYTLGKDHHRDILSPKRDLPEGRLEDCYLLDVLTIGNDRMEFTQKSEESSESEAEEVSIVTTNNSEETPTQLSPASTPEAKEGPSSSNDTESSIVSSSEEEEEEECLCCSSYLDSRCGGSDEDDCPYYVKLRRDLYTMNMTPPPYGFTPTRFGVDRRGQLVIDYSHNWDGLEVYIKQLQLC